jgi:hypothetical protein
MGPDTLLSWAHRYLPKLVGDRTLGAPCGGFCVFCALEYLTTLKDVRTVLREEVDRYTYPGIPSWYLRTG